MSTPISSVFSRKSMTGDIGQVYGNGTLFSAREPKPLVFDEIDWKKARDMWDPYFESVPLKELGATPAEQILGLLTHGHFRRGKLSDIDLPAHRENFLNQIKTAMREGKPIEMILPSFPMKVEHPLKTPRTTPDLAEVSALARLHTLSKEIQKIYPPGLTLSIGLDGHLYCELFGRSPKDATKYMRSLQDIIQKMGLGREIRVFDLKVAVQRLPDFSSAKARAEQEVLARIKSGQMHETIESLKGTAAASMGVNKWPRALVKRVFHAPLAELTPNERIARARLEGLSEKAVQDYLIINRTIELLNLYQRLNPRALRASVHPGAGKIPLQFHRKNTELMP